MQMKKLTTTGSGLAMLALIVFAVNVIAGRFSARVDVTGDKVFSLSDGTKKILGKLDSEVTAKLYFSRSLKELPVVMKTYATRVEEVLQEYAARSGGKLKLEVLDPKPDTDDEEWAQRYGINAARLPKGESMFFGVVFLHGAKEVAIPYLDPRREELLEYDLSEALISVFRKETGKIAILASLPVMGGGMPGEGGEPWVFVNDLKRNFDVQPLAPTATEVPADVKVVLVIHPKNLGESTTYALDQFVLRGGRLIALVDPMSRTDLMLTGQMGMQRGQMPDASSDLPKLFAAWGVAYDKGKLVGDASMATRINAGGAELAYPFFMSAGEGAFHTGSVIAGNLRQMLLGEPGSVALAKDAQGVTFDALIKTTKESGTSQAMLAGIMPPQDVMREMKLDGEERIVAGLLKGKLKSAFPAAPTPPPSESGSAAPPPSRPHLAESTGESTVLIVADTDFLADHNAVEKFPFGNQVMVRMRNDNLSFLSNAVDFLGGSEDLISIRSRGRIARPFTRVAALQASAQKRWQAEEERLTKELTDLQAKLNALQKERTDGNRFVMTPEQQKQVEAFREQERSVKKARRDVRRNLREDIERLGNQLVALNMLVVPFACTVFGAVVFARRGKRRKEASRVQ